MKKFLFRLQRVLDTRCHEEEVAQQVFMEARNKLSKEESTLHTLLKKQIWVFNQTRDKRSRITPASIELTNSLYREMLSKKVALQHSQIIQAQNQVDQARQTLEDTLQKRKALERLKESNYATFQNSLLHIEQQTMDEIAARSTGQMSEWTK